MAEKHIFQAEIKQLLHILVHSLYTDREIFLRELVSNAADALSKMQFQQLTTHDVLDAEAELFIEISADPQQRTLVISDSGIGMTHDELIENLGVIAQSGAKRFMESLQDAAHKPDLIGQFGVGFYSVFMVADRVEVTSRSYLPDQAAYTWVSTGDESYEIFPADKAQRGTDIRIHLRADAAEFADPWRLREIVRRHSDYIPFPIYISEVGKESSEEEENQPVNQQTAIWRRPPNEVKDEDYHNFYRNFTLDFQPPALRLHTQSDAPIQYYALLFVPKRPERNMLSPRKQDGLKLYARKVLIQDYNTDLLPDYLAFVQGVVDSEDIPLSVSREAVQNNPSLLKLKNVLTRKILGEFKALAEKDPAAYGEVWDAYSLHLKHGLISDYAERERLLPLLRFHSSRDAEGWVSFEQYVGRMAQGQKAIYYLIADSVNAARHSPHLDPFRARGIEVLFFTQTTDGLLASNLGKFQDYPLLSADSATLDLTGVGQTPEESATPPAEQDELDALLVRWRNLLGEEVESVRLSQVLAENPVRLVTPEGALDRHTQRVYQMLEREFKAPRRILEVNPRHPLIISLARNGNAPNLEDDLRLLYENALLADGIHPDPASLAQHVLSLLERVACPQAE
jgi:molecular chaperone HtpG